METNDNLIPVQTLEFEQNGHIALIGSTNSGKTFWVKKRLVSGDFPHKKFNKFAFVGHESIVPDMSKCYAASLYLSGVDWKDKTYAYTGLSNIKKAVDFGMQHREDNSHMLMFFDDAMIQDNQSSMKLKNFVNQAKQSNDTLIITMHEAFDNNQIAKTVKHACRYLVMFNLSSQTIATMTGLSKDNPIIVSYESKPVRSKIMIWDNIEKKFFYGNSLKEILTANTSLEDWK